MDKIWIIFEREYLQRVKKKSFLLGTLLTPLIFPLFIGITIFFLSSDDEKKRIISCIDYNSLIVDSIGFDNNITSWVGSPKNNRCIDAEITVGKT